MSKNKHEQLNCCIVPTQTLLQSFCTKIRSTVAWLIRRAPLYSLLQKRMTSLAKGTTEMDNMKWCCHMKVPLIMNGNFKYLCSICSCLTTNRAPLCKLLFLICCANRRLRGSGLRSAGRIVLLRPYGLALSLHWLKCTSLIFFLLNLTVQCATASFHITKRV